LLEQVKTYYLQSEIALIFLIGKPFQMFKNPYFMKAVGLVTLCTFTILSFNACTRPSDVAEQEKQKKVDEIASNPPAYCANLANPCSDPICEPYANCTISATYAGVTVKYELSSGMLKFNSVSDLNTVLNQLEVDNEAYNANYLSQYPNYTVDQLDSADSVNNFDEFKKLRDFESLFLGYNSKRKMLETTENAWLNNNFAGTDPDDLDLTFDDEENTICNVDNKFKVGTDTYEIKAEGLYINGILMGGEVSRVAARHPGCHGGKDTADYYPVYYRKYRLKVAVHSIWFRSSAKSKAVSFKQSGSKWKRSRSEMYVAVRGFVYDGQCSSSTGFNEAKPAAANSYEKRKSLKVVYRSNWGVGGAAVFRARNNEVQAELGLRSGSYTLWLP